MIIIACKIRQIATAVQEKAATEGLSVRVAQGLFQIGAASSEQPTALLVDCLEDPEVTAKEIQILRSELPTLAEVPILLLIASTEPAFLAPLLNLAEVHFALTTEPSTLILRKLQALSRSFTEGRELEMFKRALDACRTSILITDAADDRPIQFCNEAFVRMTGYTEEEILGKNARFLYGARKEQPGLQTIRGTLPKGLGCSVEVANFRKDGSEFLNQVEINPVRNEAGKVTHFISLQNDISRRKESIERFEDREAWLKSILSEAHGILFVADAELQVVFGNGGWKHAFRDATSLLDCVDPADRERVKAAFLAALANPAPFTLEARMLLGGKVSAPASIAGSVGHWISDEQSIACWCFASENV